MKILVFGSSITSSFWNGAATYYRGIYRGLSRLGHAITFAEPDAYGRQQKRDGIVDYAEVVVYQDLKEVHYLLNCAASYDLVVKHSGVGVFDELLERDVADLARKGRTRAIYWDVDAPATLDRMERNSQDSLRSHIPAFDAVLTYGGGPQVIERYRAFGAKECLPIYNGLDPDAHHPESPEERFRCDLLFVGHRLPDREQRVRDFFFRAAELAPELRFILGGEGWQGVKLPSNVNSIGHVPTTLHNVVNSSARMVLNINRDSMADVGYSPPTRIFEAAGAGACLITDAWAGIEEFFEPGSEILIARNAARIVDLLRSTSSEESRAIGRRMRNRAVAQHTYSQRAEQANRFLSQLCGRQVVAA